MANETEELDTQNNQAAEEPKTQVALTEEEIADLKHKAEVSSQNFERAKKAEAKARELEERLALAEPTVLSSEDENEDVSALRTELSEVKNFVLRQQVLDTYPQLKDVWSDFESFSTDPANVGMSKLTAAKAFLVEKDLLAPLKRQGLEKPTGGGKRIPPSSGMSEEEAQKIRTTDYKKYRDMLKKGQIKFS